MGEGILRDDLRLGKHPCLYRKGEHQIIGGCGCLCDHCRLQEELTDDKLSPSKLGSPEPDRSD